jgi:hypothetical protein
MARQVNYGSSARTLTDGSAAERHHPCNRSRNSQEALIFVGRTAATLALTACLAGGTARASPPPGPIDALGEEQLSETLQLGTLATLAPLCGLRDDRWAEDLRRGAMQSATGTEARDDQGLRAAPGSSLAVGALSYAEAEALESFAETRPELGRVVN